MTEGDETDIGPAFFEEMVESVGVGVAIYGSDGVYRYVNDAYAAMLETERDRLVGAALWEVVPEFERGRFDDYWGSFTDGETRTAETEHTFEGTTVSVATVTTRRTIDGIPYHFGTIRDVSELRARERELERQNERLDAFAGIVAHDLRNPLNVAQSYLELLDRELDREELTMMDSALGRMESLITDLLTLARQGGAPEERTSVSIEDVAARAWQNTAAPEVDLTVVDDLTVEADKSRLQQVFENLFRNAVEHGGADTLTVGALADDRGFYVADDGVGIPPDRREQVFQPGVTSADDGTGFGLAIVTEIVDGHGWTVSVTDSETGGARFEVTVDPVAD